MSARPEDTGSEPAGSARGRSPGGAGGTVHVLTCGDEHARRWSGVLARALPDAVAADVGPRPGRTEVDPRLPGAGLLVVAGDDADLAAVLVRLLRRERLDVAVALLPAPGSVAAAVWEVPTGAGEAEAALRGGVARARPLVRDDRGAVVAGRHEVGAFRGAVYCDERRVGPGQAAGLAVEPWPGGGVAVRVTGPARWGGLRAPLVHADRGRAVQIGCRPAAATRDGVADDRVLERRSWYRHTADWHLVGS